MPYRSDLRDIHRLLMNKTQKLKEYLSAKETALLAHPLGSGGEDRINLIQIYWLHRKLDGEKKTNAEARNRFLNGLLPAAANAINQILNDVLVYKHIKVQGQRP